MAKKTGRLAKTLKQKKLQQQQRRSRTCVQMTIMVLLTWAAMLFVANTANSFGNNGGVGVGVALVANGGSRLLVGADAVETPSSVILQQQKIQQQQQQQQQQQKPPTSVRTEHNNNAIPYHLLTADVYDEEGGAFADGWFSTEDDEDEYEYVGGSGTQKAAGGGGGNRGTAATEAGAQKKTSERGSASSSLSSDFHAKGDNDDQATRTTGGAGITVEDSGGDAAIEGEETMMNPDEGHGATNRGRNLPRDIKISDPSVKQQKYATYSDRTPPIALSTASLDWGLKSVCQAHILPIELHNIGKQHEVVVHTISTDSPMFFPNEFEVKRVQIGQTLTIHMVYLPRVIGEDKGSMLVHTSAGSFIVSLRGSGEANPYHITPLTGITAPVSVERIFPLNVHNSFNETLNIQEIYTNEDFAILRLPIDSNYYAKTSDDVNVKNSYNRKYGGEKSPNNNIATNNEIGDGENPWEIPSHTTKSVVHLVFRGDTVGSYFGNLRVKTNRHEMVIPMEFQAIEGNVYRVPGEVNFGILVHPKERVTKDIRIVNNGPTPIGIVKVYPYSNDDSLFIHGREGGTIDAHSEGIVASVTYSGINEGSRAGLVLVRTNATTPSGARLEIPYRAHVLYGGLKHSLSDVTMRADPNGKPMEKTIQLVNGFPMGLTIHAVNSLDGHVEILGEKGTLGSDKDLPHIVVGPHQSLPPLKVRVHGSKFGEGGRRSRNLDLHGISDEGIGSGNLGIEGGTRGSVSSGGTSVSQQLSQLREEENLRSGNTIGENHFTTASEAIDARIAIHTNVSTLFVQLSVFTGQILAFNKKGQTEVDKVEVGTVAAGANFHHERALVLANVNPVSVAIDPPTVTDVPGLTAHLNEPYAWRDVASIEDGSTKPPKPSEGGIILPPGQAVKVTLRGHGIEPGFQIGHIKAKTSSGKFSIPVLLMGVQGNITLEPGRIDFGKSFPGIIVTRPLYVKSTFEMPVRMVKAKASDPRVTLFPVSFTVLPGKRTHVADLMLNPGHGSILSPEKSSEDGYAFNSFTVTVGGAAGNMLTKAESAAHESLLEWYDANLINGTSLVHATATVYTDIAAQLSTAVVAKVERPNLHSNETDSVLDFGLVQTGTTVDRFLQVHNPSWVPLHVHLMPLGNFKGFDVSKNGGVVRSPDAFRLPPGSTVEAVVPPNSTYQLGPLQFNPSDNGLHEWRLQMKNNLTILEEVALRGEGGSGKLRFEGHDDISTPTSPLRPKRRALLCYLIDCDQQHPTSMIFNRGGSVALPVAAPIGGSDSWNNGIPFSAGSNNKVSAIATRIAFTLEGSHMSSSYALATQSPPLSSPPEYDDGIVEVSPLASPIAWPHRVPRTLSMVNDGDLPVIISGLDVVSSGSSSGNGNVLTEAAKAFAVDNGSMAFTLSPGAKANVQVFFEPDCSVRHSLQILRVATSVGGLQVQLEGSASDELLGKCLREAPLSSFERLLNIGALVAGCLLAAIVVRILIGEFMPSLFVRNVCSKSSAISIVSADSAEEDAAAAKAVEAKPAARGKSSSIAAANTKPNASPSTSTGSAERSDDGGSSVSSVTNSTTISGGGSVRSRENTPPTSARTGKGNVTASVAQHKAATDTSTTPNVSNTATTETTPRRDRKIERERAPAPVPASKSVDEERLINVVSAASAGESHRTASSRKPTKAPTQPTVLQQQLKKKPSSDSLNAKRPAPVLRVPAQPAPVRSALVQSSPVQPALVRQSPASPSKILQRQHHAPQVSSAPAPAGAGAAGGAPFAASTGLTRPLVRNVGANNSPIFTPPSKWASQSPSPVAQAAQANIVAAMQPSPDQQHHQRMQQQQQQMQPQLRQLQQQKEQQQQQRLLLQQDREQLRMKQEVILQARQAQADADAKLSAAAPFRPSSSIATTTAPSPLNLGGVGTRQASATSDVPASASLSLNLPPFSAGLTGGANAPSAFVPAAAASAGLETANPSRPGHAHTRTNSFEIDLRRVIDDGLDESVAPTPTTPAPAPPATISGSNIFGAGGLNSSAGQGGSTSANGGSSGGFSGVGVSDQLSSFGRGRMDQQGLGRLYDIWGSNSNGGGGGLGMLGGGWAAAQTSATGVNDTVAGGGATANNSTSNGANAGSSTAGMVPWSNGGGDSGFASFPHNSEAQKKKNGGV